jgi:hypothetical protein
VRAYLDIETSQNHRITVIGIYRADQGTIQLVGGGISDVALYAALDGVSTLVTFNGASFDLPTIKRCLYIDLRRDFAHEDLMLGCRRRGLRGGLKKIEAAMGIARETAGLSGFDAVQLWQRYEVLQDNAALATLLAYNRDDIQNLARIEHLLGIATHDALSADVQIIH